MYQPDPRPITIAASACLLGQEVRYDGGHKRHDYLCRVLAERFTVVPVCPEIEIGLPVPRETLELVDTNGRLRLLGSRSGDDHTEAMRSYAEQRIAELSRLAICGYVLKSRSPSCAVVLGERSSGEAGSAQRRGLFADVLIARLPGLPVVDENRLDTPASMRRFIDSVLAYHRLANPR